MKKLLRFFCKTILAFAFGFSVNLPGMHLTRAARPLINTYQTRTVHKYSSNEHNTKCRTVKEEEKLAYNRLCIKKYQQDYQEYILECKKENRLFNKFCANAKNTVKKMPFLTSLLISVPYYKYLNMLHDAHIISDNTMALSVGTGALGLIIVGAKSAIDYCDSQYEKKQINLQAKTQGNGIKTYIATDYVTRKMHEYKKWD